MYASAHTIFFTNYFILSLQLLKTSAG